MQIYTVTGSPVLVRQIASADAKIINVLPKGSKLYIIANEAGWLRTSSGYYVFQTDDIELDPNPAETLAKATARPRLMAAANTNDPTLPSNPSMPVSPALDGAQHGQTLPGGTSGDGKSKATDVDVSSISSTAADRMSEKYQGHSVKVTGSKVKIMNPDGTVSEIDTPESLTKEGNSTQIERVDQGGICVVYDAATGLTYIIDGKDLKVGTDNKEGKTEYSDFELDELAKEEQDAFELIEDLKSTLLSPLSYIESLSDMSIETVRDVFGMPYQFLPSTDPRPDVNDKWNLKKFGRKYAEKIVARAPVLIMQAGEPVFLRGYSDDIRAKITSEVVGLADSIFGDGKSDIDTLLSGGGEYYSFRLAKEDYFSCVNSACRAIAILMGLNDESVEGLKPGSGKIGEAMSAVGQDKLGNFNWMFETKHMLGGYYAGAVQFYINSDAQVQDSFSNGTRPSQLASKINQISDQAAEAMFVMGGLQADFQKTTGIGESTDVNAFTNGRTEGLSDGSSSAGLLHSIIGNISTLLAGGKMYFPEIWSDSQFQRGYNVTIKLDSPDTDPLSIYLNIMVPLCHILGFVLPRSAGANTYISPFLVRAFYKSMFHVDMGIVTSCSVTKGDQGAWTANGLPTQITVQLQIKDLYTNMSQSRGVGSNTLLSNPAQLDYLANLCGINVAPANFGRTLKLWWMIKGQGKIDSVVNSATSLLTSVWTWIEDFAKPARFKMGG